MIQAFVVFVAEFQRASCSPCIHCMNTRIAGLIAFPAWWAQTPQFDGVLHGNAALAQDAFKNLPEHALGFVDDKAQRDRLPRGWRAAA